MLGTEVDLYAAPEDVEGLVPKNIRIGFAFAELAEPYIQIQDVHKLPRWVSPGENLTLKWKVNGCTSVNDTHIQHGTLPNSVVDFNQTTQVLSGAGGFNGPIFSQNITMPEEKGLYYFTVYARVDQQYVQQASPEPDVEPQSFYVNARTNDSYSFSLAGRTITGNIDYYSKVMAVEVVHRHNTTINILEHPAVGTINDTMSLKWEILDTHEVLEQKVHYSDDRDTIKVNGLNTSSGIEHIWNGNELVYQIDIQLPSKWGYAFYQIEALTEDNVTAYSSIIKVMVEPAFKLTNITDSVFVLEKFEMTWRVIGTNQALNYTVEILSDQFDENSQVNTSDKIKGASGRFNQRFNAPSTGGTYYVRVKASIFDSRYDEDHSFVSNFVYLLVKDKIFVSDPNAVFDAENQTLSINDIRAVCTNASHGTITHQNTVTHEIIIVNSSNFGIFMAELKWSGSEWFVVIENLSNWSKEEYHVIASFWDGEHLGESVHIEGDSSEFEVIAKPDLPPERQSDDNEKTDDNNRIILIIIIIIVAIVGILGIFLRPRIEDDDFEDQDKTKDDEFKDTMNEIE
jgi:hypothetical protein